MATLENDNYEFQKIIAIVGVSLLLIKYFAFWLTGSVAIFTDATESIVNVAAAFMGLYALYLSAKPADRDHPFGHGKVEIISSALEGAMIIVAGAVIIYEAVKALLNPGDPLHELDIGLILVAFAAGVNFAVGRAAIRKGRKNRSAALEASGKHLCSDTYSSVGILIGLLVVFVAQYMGYDARWLDSSIGAVFGVIIVVTGAFVVKRSFDDTMDKADDVLLEEVTDVINRHRHNDWIDVYNLRLIKYGPKIYVDMKVVLPRTMTVERMGQENDEINAAMVERYGDDVETSINPVPCKTFHCRYCERDCDMRSAKFDHRIEWNADLLTTTEPHSPERFVTIEDDVH